VAEPPLKLTKHPPERRRPSGSVVLPCGCCCCCCCCLHTLGGVLGAAIAPSFGSTRNNFPTRYRLLVEEYEFEDDAEPFAAAALPIRKPRAVSGVALYWWIVLGFVGLAMLYGAAAGSGGSVGVAVLGLALGLPVLQILASFLAALVLVATTRDDKKYQLVQVGKITLGTVLGTVAGILAMVGIAAPFGLFK